MLIDFDLSVAKKIFIKEKKDLEKESDVNFTDANLFFYKTKGLVKSPAKYKVLLEEQFGEIET